MPTVSVKTFVLSTLWGVVVPATSSGVPLVVASGKIWDTWTRTQITWTV